MMKNLIQKTLNKFGYQITKNNSNPNKKDKANKIVINTQSLLEYLFTNLQEAGFYPKHIVDIGANMGKWSRSIHKKFPNTQISMFEPQENLSKHFQDLLQKENIRYFPIGIGNQNGVLKFSIHERHDSSSFAYTEEQAKERGFKQIEVPIRTLNSIITENNLPLPDLIKIDAEGFDLEVLDGTSDFFGKTEVFLVEASVQNKNYKNNILKVMKKMDDAGYELYEITDLNRPHKSKVLWLVELAFIKKNGLISNYPIQK